MVDEFINAEEKSEKTGSEDGNEKPNPTWGLFITKGRSRILSQYLSGPTVSFHDSCKYGVNLAIDTKPWWNAAQKMVKSRSGSKPSPTSKVGKPNSPIMIKEVGLSIMNEENVCKDTNSPSSYEEIEVSGYHTNSGIEQNQSESSSLPMQESINAQTNRNTVGVKGSSGSSRSKQRGGKKTLVPPCNPSSSSMRSETKEGIISGKEVKDVGSNDAKMEPEKVVADMQIVGESKRRNFEKEAVDGGKTEYGSRSESEYVILRHQNLERKKVAWSLYDNVIEETVSMLAEVRKSKVKALVGAFETVISLDLQEATPSSSECDLSNNLSEIATAHGVINRL